MCSRGSRYWRDELVVIPLLPANFQRLCMMAIADNGNEHQYPQNQ